MHRVVGGITELEGFVRSSGQQVYLHDQGASTVLHRSTLQVHRLLNLPGPRRPADGGVHKLAGFATGHHTPAWLVPISDNETIDS